MKIRRAKLLLLVFVGPASIQPVKCQESMQACARNRSMNLLGVLPSWSAAKHNTH